MCMVRKRIKVLKISVYYIPLWLIRWDKEEGERSKVICYK